MTLEPRLPARRHSPPRMATWEHIIPRAVLRASGVGKNTSSTVTLLACALCNHQKGAKLSAPTALILDAFDFFARFRAWLEAHAEPINIAHLSNRSGRRAQLLAQQARAAFLRKTERRNAGVQTEIAIGPRFDELLPPEMLGLNSAERRALKRHGVVRPKPAAPEPAAWITVDGVRYTPEGYRAAVAAKRERARQDQATWEREQRRVLADQIAAGNRR